jgi:predicted ATP-grasp superfamily ATP-dependent carboligase
MFPENISLFNNNLPKKMEIKDYLLKECSFKDKTRRLAH